MAVSLVAALQEEMAPEEMAAQTEVNIVKTLTPNVTLFSSFLVASYDCVLWII